MTQNTENQQYAAPSAPYQSPANPAARLTEADLVGSASLVMSQKLESARYRGREGWQTCDVLHLEQGYQTAVSKGGDPADVMNYAAMLYCRGQKLPRINIGTPQQRTCEQFVLWALDEAGITEDGGDLLEQLKALVEAGIGAQNPDPELPE